MTMRQSAAVAAALGSLSGVVLAAQVSAQGSAVTIANFKFAPATVTAAANAPITWTNNDSASHQVVVSGQSLKTSVLAKGQSGQLKIAKAGSYNYACGIHPSMTGKIEVK